MDSCADRSACSRSTAWFRLAMVISRLVSSPLVGSRHTRTTVATIWASASAVAFPIPELAPVTMQIFPCRRVFDVGMMRSFLDVRLAFQESVDIVSLSFMRPLRAPGNWELDPGSRTTNSPIDYPRHSCRVFAHGFQPPVVLRATDDPR